MPMTKAKPLKIKPFSNHKDQLIAECLRVRARAVLRLQRAEEAAPAPGSLSLADFGAMIKTERAAIKGERHVS